MGEIRESKKVGLSSFDLKIIGIVLMIIDHLGYFFEFMPSWFRMLGRLSAPIFLFLSAEGFHYTRDKGKYIRTMYFFGIINSIGNTILMKVFPDPEGRMLLINNIFLTLAVSLSIMYFIESLKNREHIARDIFMIIILAMASIFVEGSFIFVGLAVIFYLLRERKSLKFIVYILISMFLGLLPVLKGQLPISSMLSMENYQWMMVFSVIFMILYNGEKGRKLNKYFFYIFYPVHIWIMFIVSIIIR